MLSEQLRENLRIAAGVGPQVTRSALQYFFVNSPCPQRRLTMEEIAASWRAWVIDSRSGRIPERLDFYLHVPFCSHRCAYCIYYSVAPPDKVTVAAWLERIRAEIPFWGGVIQGSPLWTMYVGGGTPTVLDPSDLHEIVGLLQKCFKVRPGGERSFECNPLTLTREKALIFRDAGYNRASMGVQTGSSGMLSGVNRGYQTRGLVETAVGVLQELKFQVNLDLLQGLPGETADSLAASLSWVMGLRPTEITMYGLAPSTPDVVSGRSASRPLAAVASELSDLAGRSGYTVSVLETCVKFMLPELGPPFNLVGQERVVAGRMIQYEDVPDQPASLLAIGPTTRLQVLGSLRYWIDRYQPEQEFSPSGECAFGRSITRREAQGQYVVHRLARNYGIDGELFARYFGQSVEEVFGASIAEGEAAGLLRGDVGLIFHASDDPEKRFAVEMLFVEPAVMEMFRARLDGRSVQVDGAAYVRISAGDVVMIAAVAAAGVIPRPVRSAGGYSFMVQMADEDRDDAVRHEIVGLFSRLFEAVVTRDRPGSPEDLRDALVARGRALRISAPAGTPLHGAIFRVEQAL